MIKATGCFFIVRVVNHFSCRQFICVNHRRIAFYNFKFSNDYLAKRSYSWSVINSSQCMEVNVWMYVGQCMEVNVWRSMYGGQCMEVNVWRSMYGGQCMEVNVWRSMYEGQFFYLVFFLSKTYSDC